MAQKVRVGLIGYGKAGQAVASVLSGDPDLELIWIARHSTSKGLTHHADSRIPIVPVGDEMISELIDLHPVDAIVDFSTRASLQQYGAEVRRRNLILVSAISAYNPTDLAYARELGDSARVMCSPNITLGINFLIMAAKILRKVAPFADVRVLEQHFREKPEVSGTARKIAETLDLDSDAITSLRLGGIVGHHEVIFGFPHQTVRLTHDSIRREAFGTGAAFAIKQLRSCPYGFYSFEELLLNPLRTELIGS